MKSAEECSQWIRDFLDWIKAAPEGCKKAQPYDKYWELDNCSEDALKWLKCYWGGRLEWTGGNNTLILDFNICEYAFRFIHEKE